MVTFPGHQVWPKPPCKAQWKGKKTRQTEEEVGRQHQGMDRPGLWQVPEGSGEQGKMEKTGCKIICGAPTTLAVKGLMMMMMSGKSCTAVLHLPLPIPTIVQPTEEQRFSFWNVCFSCSSRKRIISFSAAMSFASASLATLASAAMAVSLKTKIWVLILSHNYLSLTWSFNLSERLRVMHQLIFSF